MSVSEKPRWLPLESNPEVMSKFLYGLGVSEKLQIVDVLGFDDCLLEMVPQPVLAVILLFPITQNYSSHCASVLEKLKNEEQAVSDKVYFMRQTISNACGTIALIHSIANNSTRIQLAEGSSLQSFLSATARLSPEQRAEILEKEGTIGVAHGEYAQEGQTAAPSLESSVDLHFVAFVNVDGNLYELDGRKNCPLNHGPSAPNSFLKDACKICQEYMDRDPGEMRFTVVALAENC